jgi:hypothetical protein
MANYTVWGNTGNQAYALPMYQLQPTDPTAQGYTLAWDIINQALNYAPLNWDFSTGDATSAGNWNLSLGKVYKINNVQVLGARITGWAAATNTKSKATFDTATVTVAQLAQRVGQLIDDLTTHGIIGA